MSPHSNDTYGFVPNFTNPNPKNLIRVDAEINDYFLIWGIEGKERLP